MCSMDSMSITLIPALKHKAKETPPKNYAQNLTRLCTHFRLNINLLHCFLSFNSVLAGLFRDKAEIRPLYKQHKNLERELERFADQVSLEPPDAAAEATSAAAPSAPEEPSDELDADIPALLSPTSSIGAGEMATSQQGNPESPTVPAKEVDSESQLDKNNSEESRKDGVKNKEATAFSAIPASSDLEGQASTDILPSTGQDGDLQGSGHGREGEAKEDGAPERSGGSREGEVKEEEGDGGGASETQRGIVSDENENGSEIPEGDSATDHLQQEEPSQQQRVNESPGDSAVTSPTPVLSPADDATKLGVAKEEGSSEVAMGSATGDEGDAPEEGDDGDKGGLDPCVEGESYETWPSRAREDTPGSPASLAEGDKDDNGNDKPMTAQEARVKRMRTRFLRMKNLIDDDAVGGLVAESSSLSDGVEENDDGITSPPGEPIVPVVLR